MIIPMDKQDADGWRIDVQAGAGVVIDSQPELEWKETRNKAAALGRAIELAESAFGTTRTK
jgi:anthranilate synthase component 1